MYLIYRIRKNIITKNAYLLMLISILKFRETCRIVSKFNFTSIIFATI